VTRKAGQRIVAAALIAAAAWFLGSAVAANWQALREHEWQVSPPLLVASLAVHVGVLAWGVLIWARTLRLFGGPSISFLMLLRIWFLSNLARYIPGKIFQFVAVAQLARGAHLPSAALLASLLVHTGFSLLAAMVLAAFTVAGPLLPVLPSGALGAAVLVGAILLVHPSLLNHVLAAASRLARRDLLRWSGRWGDGLALLSLSVGSWALYGAAFYLFLASLTPLPLASLPLLSGVNALSFVAGYMAIVTPGGLGVREAAMTALLQPVVPLSVAAILAIASRLWTIAAELAGGAAVLLMRRKTPPEVAAGGGSAPTSD